MDEIQFLYFYRRKIFFCKMDCNRTITYRGNDLTQWFCAHIAYGKNARYTRYSCFIRFDIAAFIQSNLPFQKRSRRRSSDTDKNPVSRQFKLSAAEHISDHCAGNSAVSNQTGRHTVPQDLNIIRFKKRIGKDLFRS